MEAHADAELALIRQSELERQMRAMKQQTTAKLRHYERLLLEYNGQLTIPDC